ncbi:MAG: tetratricopeptide repeat protein [Nitrospira sp.]|nr:tetratricopeptide repeat protein [Nitrospira sp.]
MEEFRHKDYPAALGFRFFLQLHGQSSLSANAQYWMGECQYRMGRHNDALASFFKLISDYPMSQKLAASTLKIGQIYTKQDDRDKAQMMYERVTGQYPDSPKADVARKALEAEAAKGDPVAAEPDDNDPRTAYPSPPRSSRSLSPARQDPTPSRAPERCRYAGGSVAQVEHRLPGARHRTTHRRRRPGIMRHRRLDLYHLLH